LSRRTNAVERVGSNASTLPECPTALAPSTEKKPTLAPRSTKPPPLGANALGRELANHPATAQKLAARRRPYRNTPVPEPPLA
jgi:hypothetical protein